MSEVDKSSATVVKVLDEFTVVINRGREHLVREGDKYLIYHLDDEEIIDPDTGENLGKLEVLRGTGVVTYVQEKMATVKSSRKEPGKKVVRKPLRSSIASIAMAASLASGRGNDEIVEEEPPEDVPFDSPGKGDKAKLTN